MATRTTREPLTRERVLGAAMELADREGLAAVTMRRLAAELGVEAMSLYHHLPGKDALLDGLVEAIVSEIGVATARLEGPDSVPDWRTTLWQRCLTARDVMQAHPWAPGLIGSRSTIPPSLYVYFERILATLVEAGFSYHLAHRALHSLGSMVLGFVQELFSPAPSGEPVDEAAAEAELAALAEALPHLAAMVASELHDHDDDPLGWCDSRAEFEFTLGLILDGLARARDLDPVRGAGSTG